MSFFFLGFQKNAAMVLNNLDIFVLPSVSEGFSISTIEAMSCGLPIVVTRSGGPEEIVESEKNGLVVNPSELELSNALIRFIADSSLSRLVTCNSQKDLESRFSFSGMLDKYSDIYTENS